MEEILTEYQKENIKKRLNLNFYQELEKSRIDIDRKNFSKKFKTHLDILIDSLYNDGVFFYSFNISMPFLEKDDVNLWYYTHLQVEGWLSTFKTEIELIEFCYFSIELNKKIKKNTRIKNFNVYEKNFLDGLPNINGILGVRSLLGKNSCHLNEMKKIFKIWKGIDFDVKELKTQKIIKNNWNFVIKENNFKFHRFQYFSKFYQFDYGDIMDLELLYDDSHIAFDLVHNFESKNSNLLGISERFPDDLTILNYLFSLYMNEKEYYINNNNIYKKIEESKFSWEVMSSLDFFRLNNLKILNELKEIFPQQLKGLKVSKILNQSWDKFFEQIKKNNHYLPSIEFNTNVIEFTDGLYFLDKNCFIELERGINVNSRFFFEKTFWQCKEKLPLNWLDNLSKTLNHKDISMFCSILGGYFSLKTTFKDNHTLCIIDESNTGNIDLLLNILIKTFGIEQLGFLSQVDYDQIETKKLLIVREFEYFDKNLKELLNYMSNNNLTKIEKGDNTFLRSKIPILFLFNSKIDDKKFLDNKLVYKFVGCLDRETFNNILQQELAQIIIYCNNLYFEIHSELINKKFY